MWFGTKRQKQRNVSNRSYHSVKRVLNWSKIELNLAWPPGVTTKQMQAQHGVTLCFETGCGYRCVCFDGVELLTGLSARALGEPLHCPLA